MYWLTSAGKSNFAPDSWTKSLNGTTIVDP